MPTALLYKFNCGNTLTDKELLELEKEMLYYSGSTMPANSWFHQILSTTELSLLRAGAYGTLLRVQDIIEARKIR